MQNKLDISVIICTHTEERWLDLCSAVESVRRQTVLPREIIVVVDHNPSLLDRVHNQITEIKIVENKETPGLAGARNSGLAIAKSEISAFLDDDAIATPDWVEHLQIGFSDPMVLGVGGPIEPLWVGNPPKWFPEEFYWVIGCTYRGLPDTTAPVRNLIGCNMSFRHELFDTIGGFRTGIGRNGSLPVGCEETEFCIRGSQHWPNKIWLNKSDVKVHHQVPSSRVCWGYFLRRCFYEGKSKALVTLYVGKEDGLASERRYAFRVLPKGIINGIIDTITFKDLSGFVRALAILVGLATTAAGYIRESISILLSPTSRVMT